MNTLLFLSLLVQAAAEEGTSPTRRLAQDPALASLLAPYEFGDREFSWRLRPIGSRGGQVHSFELTFSSAIASDPEENRTVWAKYWRPAGRGPFPALVLLHWLGGTFEALELIGYRFAEQGVCALMVSLPHYGKRRAKDPAKRETMISRSVEKTLANFRQGVLDVRRSGDWLASRAEIDPARVGVMGISLGAVVGALAAGVDTNFARTILVIGGGDLASILFHESEATQEVREELKKLGYTPDRVRREWKGIDPVTFAGRIPTETAILFNAENDEIIPRAATERLHAALGSPRIEWFKGGHYAVITQLGTILRKSVEFLQRPVPIRVRVLLAEDQESVSFSLKSGLVAFKPGTDDELYRTDGPIEAKSMNGRVRLGEREFDCPILLVPRETGTLRFGKFDYHGSLLLVPASKGRVHAINVVDLERYVMGVLGPEIGKNAPAEAQKAQAVAARTYAVVTRMERRSGVFDLYADVRDQVYRGVPKDDVYVRAVEATPGELLFYRGAPVKTYFHSTCGGRTESVFEWRKETEIEPLVGGPCGFCDGAKWAAWSARLSPEEIAAALRENLGGRAVENIAIKSSTKSGRAREVAIAVAGGEVLLPAPHFRAALGYDKFRSTFFTVRRDGSAFVFSGRGWGHGVGLCQEGAIGMASAGKNHREILARYYPGSTLERR